MSQLQQTVLRVQTNKPSTIIVTGNTSLSFSGSTTGVTATGNGTSESPYTGTLPTEIVYFTCNVQGDGVFYYNVSLTNVQIGQNFLQLYIKHTAEQNYKYVFTSFSTTNDSYFSVKDGDSIIIKQGGAYSGGTFNVYFVPSEQTFQSSPNEYDYLDLYSDIPLTINKSYAEIQDIGKRNSDYSVGIKLPGSKRNNAFFENFFNVDQQSLYFDATAKVQCNVLINDESYFTGYMKLNRVSVQLSKIEYDITLYSNIGDLYGEIGNNLLKDLDFRDPDYHFNHYFTRDNVLSGWRYETLKSVEEVPSKYFYPVIHNGYNYEISGETSQVLFTGLTGNSLYTTTQLGNWANNAAAYSAGVQRYRINSPEDGIRDNQLKPSLNLYSIIKLIFKTYGYTIKSDFMSTPWMKLLYMYGYFSNDTAKFSYKTPRPQIYGIDGVEVILVENKSGYTEFNCSQNLPRTDVYWTFYIVKKGTGIPVLCNQPIVLNFDFTTIFCFGTIPNFPLPITIPKNTTGTTYNYTEQQYVDCGFGCPFFEEQRINNGFLPFQSTVQLSTNTLSYLPLPENETVEVTDGTYVDFSLIIDQNIKQIDILSSVAKKFGLLFIPDPEVPNQIIIEPYNYYVGTGDIYDWTDKLSWDKGFSVEPVQNFIESELILTDDEDGDAGNKDFKDSNNRLYGENKQFNPTEFKSQNKEIKTNFSPLIVRKWNPNSGPNAEYSEDVGIPLGISYVEQSQEISGNNKSLVDWIYKGVKTKPKLFYNLGNFSPFLDAYEETFNLTGVTTSYFRVAKSDASSPSGGLISPVISHTMPMGNPDINKINNDSICILFNSEEPTTLAGDSVSLFDAFTNQDLYNLFYENRVSNAFDKNTRMLTGYFDLKLQDVKNIEAKDLIKINNQYFTWNKIDNYNLTNQELTKVELVQANYNPQTYPTRYFNYQYCTGDTTTYKFETEFTGTNSIYESLYYWSILYDYFCGALGASDTNLVTGFTSSIRFTGSTYLPYSMWEVTEAQYNTTGTTYTSDPNRYFFLLSTENEPVRTIYNQNNPVWLINSGQTAATLNVFTGCTEFYTVANTLGVNYGQAVSASTYNTGVTINVTDTGWIRYDTSTTEGVNQFFSTTGNHVLSGCVDCESLRPAFPLFDLGSWTVVTCGSPCP